MPCAAGPRVHSSELSGRASSHDVMAASPVRVFIWLCKAVSSTATRLNELAAALVQLDLRLGTPRQQTRDAIERHLDGAMQRHFVHLIQRAIHYFREPAFDAHRLAGDEAHQIADRRIIAERNQRTKVAILEGRQLRVAVDAALKL